MIRFASKTHRTTLVSTLRHNFGSLPEVEKPDGPARKLKATPAAGFRIPKEKSGEEVIGTKFYGDTDIFSKPKNYNFALRRDNEEKSRFRIVKLLIALSAIPIGNFLYNAEENFKKA